MALIVEDGTSVEGANSYVTLQETEEYLSARCSSSEWFNKKAEHKEELLKEATMFLDELYVWKGARTYQGQSLYWPRTGVRIDGQDVAVNSIPVRIKTAVMHLAEKAASEPLIQDVDPVRIKKENFGPFSIEYADEADEGRKSYKTINAMVAPYVSSGIGSVKIGRA